MGKSRSTRPVADDSPASVSGSAGRLIVTYVDGSWTDNLAIARYVLESSAGELTLSIDLTPRERPGKIRKSRAALREFVAKLGSVHTVQVGKPRFATHLRGKVRGLEHSQIGVRLRASGHAVTYPAGIAFGPDEITLNLG